MERSDTMVHSDTLFSALCNAFVRLYGEGDLPTWMENVLVSSVFPGVRWGEKDILFFPVPLSIVPPVTDLVRRKKAKSVRWFSQEALGEVISTFDPEWSAFRVDVLDERRFVLVDGQYALTASQGKELQERSFIKLAPPSQSSCGHSSREQPVELFIL